MQLSDKLSTGATVEVAALQFGTSLDVEENSARALKALYGLAALGRSLDLVCLPEMFTFRALGTPIDSDFATPAGSHLERQLAGWARAHHSFLVAGSYLRREADGRVYNSSLIFDREGRQLGVYRKTHLFDAPGHSESTWVTPGSHLATFNTEFAKVGVAICYELRFPEVARQLALAGCEIIVVPNSWPVDGTSMGNVQLETLLKGTALQNLSYILHCNQFGRVASLDLCGGSCVVDPKGEVVARASDREEALVHTVAIEYVEDVRRRRTTFLHRRPELYRPEAVVELAGETANAATPART
jgi:predicted amidohydrolase